MIDGVAPNGLFGSSEARPVENIRIETSQNVALQVDVAGLGDRVIAAMLDYLVLAAYLLGAAGLLQLLGVGSVPRMGMLLIFLPAFFYFLACEILLDGQSIGKRYMNVRVARLDGTAPTVGNYVIRWLLRPIDIAATSGLGAVLSILITGTGQRLGDLAAGTTVVRVSGRTGLDDTLYTEVDDDYEPVFPEARDLSDEHVTTVKEVLNTLDDAPTAASDLGERTKAALERKLGVSSDLPPRDFLQTILRDYTALYGNSDVGSRRLE